MRLFVYGSLRAGEAHHGRLRKAARIATAQTVPRYRLVDLGAYPALLEGGTTSVQGEVYEVEPQTLDELDEFEGAPLLFRRGPVDLDGAETASAYFLADAARDQVAGAPQLPDGDWTRRDRTHRRRT